MGRLAPVQELLPGPSGSPGEVQEELICRIIVSPASSQQLSRVSAMRQTGVSLASKLKHKQRRWKVDGLEEEKQSFSLSGLTRGHKHSSAQM